MLHVLKASNAAALMVTHDAEEAMFMSDRIVVLRDGHVVQTGRPVNLYCQPSSAFVAEFFGEVNRVEGVVAKDKVITPLGEFRAPKSLSDGSPASVVIRHEAMLIDAGNDGVVGEVMESRLLGRASLIHLSVPTGRDVLHLHARIPGLNSIEVGSQVRVRVDPAQAFVFAAGNGDE
jgi:iron(III) transport system ATP-binding protein